MMIMVADNTVLGAAPRAPKAEPKVQVVTGEMLTIWRERMGFSQRDACDALGCARGAWQNWEAGRRPVPRYIALACTALSVGMTSGLAETA